MKGWIKLHRELLSHWVFNDADILKLWIYILLSAAVSERRIFYGGKVTVLSPGQLIFGRKALSKELHITENRIRRMIQNLIDDEMIHVKSMAKYSLLTITNWRKWAESVNNIPSGGSVALSESENLYNNHVTGDQNVTTYQPPANTDIPTVSDIPITTKPPANHQQTTSKPPHTRIKEVENDNNKKEYILSIEKIIDYLNEKTGSVYKKNTASTIRHISARLNEGYTEEHFFSVIDKKVKEWKNTEFQKYLRPETLFSTKFEGYLNQKIISRNKKTNIAGFEQRDDYTDDQLMSFNTTTFGVHSESKEVTK